MSSTSTSATDDSARTDGRRSTLVGAGLRIAADLFIVTVWVLFLTLLFLETAWPRWAFYALLLLGIGVYVAVTAAWVRGDERNGR